MSLSHEEISRSLLDSGAINYEALGQWIAKIGPELAINDRGWHGVIIGKYNHLACMRNAADLTARVGDLRKFAGVQQAIEIALDETLNE
jgi:hypothetical protein